MVEAYLRFDGMVWPNPADPDAIEHTLRYRGLPTRSDLLYAASFVAAYKQLIRDDENTRNAKIRAIRQRAYSGSYAQNSKE